MAKRIWISWRALLVLSLWMCLSAGGVLLAQGERVDSQLSAVERLEALIQDAIPGGSESAEPNSGLASQAAAAWAAQDRDALAAALDAIEADWGPAVRKLVVAKVTASLGNRQAGLGLLEQAAADHPSDAGICIEFGRVAFDQGRLSDALAQFEKALRLTEAAEGGSIASRQYLIRCYDGLANVALRQKHYAKADEYLAKLSTLVPNDPSLLRRQGEAAFRLGQTDQALLHLTAFAQAVPEALPAEVQLASLCVADGNRQQAVRWLGQAVEKHGDNVPALIQTARLYFEIDEAEMAEELVVSKLQGQTTESLQLLRGQLAMDDHPGLARAYFDELCDERPASWGYKNLLALALAESDDRKDRQTALELARENQRANGTRIEVVAVLGWLEYRIGDENRGRQILSELLSELARLNLPIDRDTAYLLAVFQEDQGQLRGARNLLTKALGSTGAFLNYQRAKLLLEEIEAKLPDEAPQETPVID